MRSSQARPGIASPNRPDDEQSLSESRLQLPGEPLQSLRQPIAGMGLRIQAPDVFSLSHTLSPQERVLMRARRTAGVTLPMSSDIRRVGDEKVMAAITVE